MSLQQPPSADRKTTFGETLFGHFILFLGCVAFPAFMTAVVPLSVVKFTRNGESIRAEVSKRLLFIVPYRRITVADVIAINDQFRAGTSTSSSRRSGSSSGAVSSEDEAFLVIQGDANSATVEVSPVNIGDVLEKARAFLDDPAQANLRLVTVANWKFGVFGGGLLCLLTLFYIFIIVDSSARAVWRRLRGPATHKVES